MPVPPVAAVLILPLLPPLHKIFVAVLLVHVNMLGAAITTCVVTEQPITSVAVIVYVLAVNEVNIPVLLV